MFGLDCLRGRPWWLNQSWAILADGIKRQVEMGFGDSVSVSADARQVFLVFSEAPERGAVACPLRKQGNPARVWASLIRP